MRSWDVLPNAILKRAGPITDAFVEIGIVDFRSAAACGKGLLYGRNTDPSDAMAVFRDHRGTCSTKHALLRD
jgi:hypothetical protein